MHTNCSFGTWPLYLSCPFFRVAITANPPPHRSNVCDNNVKTNQDQTALHLAVHQGHARIIERLVRHGVDMNVPDGDGETDEALIF